MGTKPHIEPHSIFPLTSRSEDEQKYFRIVDEAIVSEMPRVFSNGQPAHAIYVIFKFLQCATNSVKIYTGSLKQRLAGNLGAYADQKVIDTAIHFLKKPESELCVILADKLDVEDGKSCREHPLVNAIHDADIQGKFTLYRENAIRVDFPEHLLIMDDRAVRVEKDSEETKAFVCFGDYEAARLAIGLFEDIREGCDQLYAINTA